MKKPKNKVKTSNENEFPGYPKYAPEEDITQQAKRVEGNLSDEISLDKIDTKKISRISETEDKEMAEGAEDRIKLKSESDVTEEDLQALGPVDLSMDMGDDELLKQRSMPVDFSGRDLDIPGADLDDESEEIGSEDEENNSYSLGGDNHEDLEESRS